MKIVLGLLILIFVIILFKIYMSYKQKKFIKRRDEFRKARKVDNIKITPDQIKKPLRISTFQEGDFGYISHSYVVYDQLDYLWISNYSTDFSKEKDIFNDVKIIKLKDGFEVDLSECSSDKWCSDQRYTSSSSDYKVLSLIGLEQWEQNVKDSQREQKIHDLKVKEILKKLTDEEKILLGFNEDGKRKKII